MEQFNSTWDLEFFNKNGHFLTFNAIIHRIEDCFVSKTVKEKYELFFEGKTKKIKLIDESIFESLFINLYGYENLHELTRIITYSNSFLKNISNQYNGKSIKLRDILIDTIKQVLQFEYLISADYNAINILIGSEEPFVSEWDLNNEFANYDFNKEYLQINTNLYLNPTFLQALKIRREYLFHIGNYATNEKNIIGIKHHNSRASEEGRDEVGPDFFNEMIRDYFKGGGREESMKVLFDNYLKVHPKNFLDKGKWKDKQPRGLNLTVAAFTFKAIENKWIKDNTWRSKDFINVYYENFFIKIKDPKVFQRETYTNNKSFKKYLAYFSDMPKNGH